MPMSFEPGAPVTGDAIPLCVPEIGGNEWEYIKACIDSGWVSSAGNFVNRFERDFAAYTGAAQAVSTVNCTAALHVALLVAGIQANDEVLIPALTFIAPANAIRYIGAWPVFIDVEPNFCQIDPLKTKMFLEKGCCWRHGKLINKQTNRCVKAILPVHILGHSVDMDPILKIARKFNLRVIEDAAESLGAKYKNQNVGTLGDIACFSFNGNKIITTGGGGMIVTDNKEFAGKARYLTTQAKDDAIEYIHNDIGYNYRLTNIHAAMGVAQLERLDEHIAAKRRLANIYNEQLSDIPGIIILNEAKWAYSTFWLNAILIDEEKFGMTSRQLLKRLLAQNIQTRPLWHPIYSLPHHKNCTAYHINEADRLYQKALCLPSSVGLIDEDQRRVIDAILDSCYHG